MRVSFVYEETDEIMESFIIDALPRPGDVVQFLNPMGQPLIVSGVYWQCYYATPRVVESIAIVQVNLRRMTPQEMEHHKL